MIRQLLHLAKHSKQARICEKRMGHWTQGDHTCFISSVHCRASLVRPDRAYCDLVAGNLRDLPQSLDMQDGQADVRLVWVKHHWIRPVPVISLISYSYVMKACMLTCRCSMGRKLQPDLVTTPI